MKYAEMFRAPDNLTLREEDAALRRLGAAAAGVAPAGDGVPACGAGAPGCAAGAAELALGAGLAAGLADWLAAWLLAANSAARCFSICGMLKKYCQPSSTRPDRITARMVLRLSVIDQVSSLISRWAVAAGRGRMPNGDRRA